MEQELHQLRFQNNLLTMQVLEQQEMLDRCGWEHDKILVLESMRASSAGASVPMRLTMDGQQVRLFRVTAGMQHRFVLASNGDRAVSQCMPFEPEMIFEKKSVPKISCVEVLQVRVQGHGDRFF
jgi:hypothetical protein